MLSFFFLLLCELSPVKQRANYPSHYYGDIMLPFLLESTSPPPQGLPLHLVSLESLGFYLLFRWHAGEKLPRARLSMRLVV